MTLLAELELSGVPDAVPRARAFVRDTLREWGDDELTPDAELVTTELTTNALLHAGTPLRVRIAIRPAGVRIEVADGSRATPIRGRPAEDSMTGRGLAVVHAIASKFGVDPAPDGKVVWAELARGHAPTEPADFDVDTLLAMWDDEPSPAGVDPQYTVALGDVPVDLLLAAKAHVENLVREFTLAASGAAAQTTAAMPPHLAELVSMVVNRFADARQAIKRQALEAHARGDTRVTLSLTAPLSTAEAGEDYLAALDEADEWARAARLLTLESPPAYRLFRHWYVGGLVEQLRRAAAGRPPLEPVPFEERLFQELAVLTRAQRRSDRAARLQSVSAALARATSPEEVATAVLEEGVAALRASGGGLLVPTESDRLAVPATVGYGEALVERLRSESRDDELPAAMALRLGESIWLESAEERDARFPELAGLEPGTVSVCAVPLIVESEVLGALRFSFDRPRLFDEDERAFVRALGTQTGQALARTQLLAAQRRLTERLTRLQQLANALSGTRQVSDVAAVVVEHTYGLLGSIRSTVVAPVGPEGELAVLDSRGEETEALQTFHRFPADAALPAAEALRTGSIVVLADRDERQRRYPELAAASTGRAEGSVCIPLVVGSGALAVVSLVFDRQIGPSSEDMGFLRTLADSCAQAFDRARAWEDAQTGQRRLRFLAEASAELANSLDYEATLAKVVQLSVPELADWCTVEVAEDGRFRTIAVGHVDPAKVDLAYELQRRFPVDPDARVGTPNVVRTGRSELFATIDDDMLAESIPDAEQRQVAKELGLRSAIIVPLPAGGRAVGALTMIRAESGRNFTEDDLPFAEELGRQCGLALERARLFTAERAARERTAYLAEASDVLASTLDPEETLDHLVRLVVPRLADWAVVYVVENGVPVARAVRHRQDDTSARIRAELLGRPAPVTASAGVGAAVAGSGTQVYRTMPADMADRAIRLVRDESLADAVRPRSGIVSPLTYRGEVLGVLALARVDGPPYDDDDKQLVDELAARAVVAVVNARQYARERDAALTLQTSLLPQRWPEIAGVQFTWRYLPGAAGTQIGGDWYDVIPLENGEVGLVIGDVMGRGLQAAAVMGQLRATARAHASAGTPPSEVLQRLGVAVERLEQAQITTTLFAVLDPVTRRLTVASAGHLPPLVTAAGEEPAFLQVEPGPPLGTGATDYPELTVTLPAGATMLLYTDGLVEDRDLPVDAGMRILREAASGSMTPDALCDVALSALGRLDGHEDDTAMLAITLAG